MKIDDIKQLVEPYIDKQLTHFQINKQMFSNENGRKIFNRIIRENVEKRFGVYIWVANSTNEVIYIGKAGKINQVGKFGSHSVQNRLIASRGKDKITKKDIQTNDYIRNFMITNEVEVLDFYIMYSKDREPPAYIEALLLYNFYKTHNRLPILNNSF